MNRFGHVQGQVRGLQAAVLLRVFEAHRLRGFIRPNSICSSKGPPQVIAKQSPMPEICRFFGVIITMNYNDHLPPHFHTRYGGHKAIVDIRGPRLLEGYLPPRVFGLVMEWAVIQQTQLLGNWERARKNAPLLAIPPLE